MDQKTSDPWKNFKWAGGAVFVVWLAFAALIMYYGEDFTKSGPYGDTFGLLNTLFTGLAFAGMICTLIMQRQELELQRQELADTRAELARTAKANEESAKLAKENIEEQRKIFEESNRQRVLSIKMQTIMAKIDYFYKKIENSEKSVPLNSREKVIHECESNIIFLLDDLEKLYPNSPSKPEA